jgi:hypothetical protein
MKKLRSVTQTAALLAFTGSLAVFAPNANANSTINWPPVPFPAPGVTHGTATFKGVSIGGGSGQFTFANPLTGFYTANLNFNPSYNSAGVTQKFSYTLESTSPFVATGLTSQMQAFFETGAFTKKVCAGGFGVGPCTTISTSGSASTGVAPIPLVGGPATMIYVEDEYTTTGNGLINGISNSFFTEEFPTDRVPGPLPLLGAGAAFGFSRKLRNRMKLAA